MFAGRVRMDAPLERKAVEAKIGSLWKTVQNGGDTFYLKEERRRRSGCAAIEMWRFRRPHLNIKMTTDGVKHHQLRAELHAIFGSFLWPHFLFVLPS